MRHLRGVSICQACSPNPTCNTIWFPEVFYQTWKCRMSPMDIMGNEPPSLEFHGKTPSKQVGIADSATFSALCSFYNRTSLEEAEIFCFHIFLTFSFPKQCLCLFWHLECLEERINLNLLKHFPPLIPLSQSLILSRAPFCGAISSWNHLLSVDWGN